MTASRRKLLRRSGATPLRRTVVSMAHSRDRGRFAEEVWCGSIPEELLRFPRTVSDDGTQGQRQPDDITEGEDGNTAPER